MRETRPGSSETRTNTRGRKHDDDHLPVTSCKSAPKKKQRTFLQRVCFFVLPSLRLTAEEFRHGMKNGELPLAHRAITVDGLELNADNHMILPEGLHLINLSFCKWSDPVILPEGVTARSVLVEECTGPVNLALSKQTEELIIYRCSGSIITLSGTMHSRTESHILSCTSLTINLSEGLHMGKNLEICYSSITHLSGKLSVNHDLHCEHCPNLTSLPEQMSVGKDLLLSSLHNLASLPRQLGIGGNIIIRDCPSLTSLPNWIATLGYTSKGYVREVTLENTGISNDILDRLRDAPSTGMRFHISTPARTPYITFETLPEALDFWCGLAQSEEGRPTIDLTAVQQREFIIFLSRLTATAEYKNINSKQHLANRVLNILPLLEDDELKEYTLLQIHDAISSWNDRIILALDELELSRLVNEAEQQSTEDEGSNLRVLGKKMFLLEQIRKIEENHIKQLYWVDEVEVRLAYQIGLAEKFELPLPTKHMLFRNYAQVSDEDIAQAAEQIEKQSTDEKLDAFMNSWSPWKKYQRRCAIKPYAELSGINILIKTECPITKDITDDMVCFSDDHRIMYSYDALCYWYIAEGIDPVSRQPVNCETWETVARVEQT